MEIIFYLFVIMFYLCDFFFFCRGKKNIYGFHQIFTIFFAFLGNTFYLYFSENLFLNKLDLFFLSGTFLVTSYFSYLNILAFVSRSGSFLLLVHYFEKNVQPLEKEEIFKLEHRVSEILEKKFAIENNNRLKLTKKGRFLLNLYKLCIKIFKIKVVG